MARDCRLPGCEEPRENGKYCSVQHELKFEHIKEDARQARLDEEAEAPRREPDPVSDAEFRRMVL